jgi:glycine dehydrogenase subunit 2
VKKPEPAPFEALQPDSGEGFVLPRLDVPVTALPAALLRSDLDLPEPDARAALARFAALSAMDAADAEADPAARLGRPGDTPALAAVAEYFGFRRSHGALPAHFSQGALELCHRLQEDLAELGGFAAASVHPPSTRSAIRALFLMARAWHASRSSAERFRVYLPDNIEEEVLRACEDAGLDPAIINLASDGRFDMRALETALDERSCAVFLRLPDAEGRFDPGIAEACSAARACGALTLCDGSGLGPLLGAFKPADLGIDLLALDLGRAFRFSPGGGATAILAQEALADFLPAPRAVRLPEGDFRWERPERTIGRICAGPVPLNEAAMASYEIRTLGASGLARRGRSVLLSVAYLRSALEGTEGFAAGGPRVNGFRPARGRVPGVPAFIEPVPGASRSDLDAAARALSY